MKIPGSHFCHNLLFYFQKDKNALPARKILCDVYGETCLTERQCQHLFAHFHSEDFAFEDAPLSGCPIEVDEKKKKKKQRSKLTKYFVK